MPPKKKPRKEKGDATPKKKKGKSPTKKKEEDEVEDTVDPVNENGVEKMDVEKKEDKEKAKESKESSAVKESTEGKEGKDGKDGKEGKEPEIILTPEQKAFKDISGDIKRLVQAVQTHERRLMARVVHKKSQVRASLTPRVLYSLAQTFYPEAWKSFNTSVLSAAELTEATTMLELVESQKEKKRKEELAAKAKEAAAAAAAGGKPVEEKAKPGEMPEVQVYLLLLTLLWSLDQNSLKAPQAFLEKMSNALLEKLRSHNKRTLDYLSADVYFYFALIHERGGKLKHMTQQLLAWYRTACLQHNEPGQAVLANAILRNYLDQNLYTQADKFRLNIKFPDTANDNQLARHLYYVGTINAIQLHYSAAFNNLSQALRKGPQVKALGFRMAVQRQLVIVQLLMGDMPDRAVFNQKDLKKPLEPYFKLTQAVRVGNLAAFAETVTAHKQVFTKHKTLSLITRLRHNVIKTGLRKINLSYSRISIKDICAKLQLESEEDAEYIVAKAIHDGVIQAIVDRAERFMFSRDTEDRYSTQEPQEVFHRRVALCLDLHNDAVKAMRYPPDAHKSQSELQAEAAEKKKQAEKEKKEKEEKEKKEEGKEGKKEEGKKK